jgi:hypothetical protein
MSKVAIKGHPSRGKEIIEILEMLGGKNTHDYICNMPDFAYSINEQGIIEWFISRPNSIYTIFTLEEFLEKYPYKVRDKVKAWVNDYYGVFDIQNIRWSNLTNEVGYKIHGHWYSVRNLQPYKEAPMYLNRKVNEQAEEIKKILEPVKKIIEEKDKAKAPDLKGEDYSFRRFGYKIPSGYEFECVRNNEIILKPIKPQYPKTYVKCCDILNVDPYNKSAGYKSGLITAFRNLLICRDAYWKIAGEQMGLGKPWEPDWGKADEIKYCTVNTEGNITKWVQKTTNKILAFPTEEMRDVFYENFKELIELCKELL